MFHDVTLQEFAATSALLALDNFKNARFKKRRFLIDLFVLFAHELDSLYWNFCSKNIQKRCDAFSFSTFNLQTPIARAADTIIKRRSIRVKF